MGYVGLPRFAKDLEYPRKGQTEDPGVAILCLSYGSKEALIHCVTSNG